MEEDATVFVRDLGQVGSGTEPRKVGF